MACRLLGQVVFHSLYPSRFSRLISSKSGLCVAIRYWDQRWTEWLRIGGIS